MFLELSFSSHDAVQQLILILNTVLLIAILVTVELVYAEKPAAKRRHLRQFYPIVAVFVGLLLFAAYQQVGKG